jgi:hypothetical protein
MSVGHRQIRFKILKYCLKLITFGQMSLCQKMLSVIMPTIHLYVSPPVKYNYQVTCNECHSIHFNYTSYNTEQYYTKLASSPVLNMSNSSENQLIITRVLHNLIYIINCDSPASCTIKMSKISLYRMIKGLPSCNRGRKHHAYSLAS